VALAVCALGWVTLVQFDIGYDKNSLYFLFFASVTAYNFVKYFGLAKFHHRSLASWLRIIQVFSALAFLVMCYYVLKLTPNSIILLVVLGVITFLYAIPFLPKHYLFDEQQNLRQIGGIKIYVIALVWTCATVVLPLLNNQVGFSADVYITIAQRCCFVLSLMLPFEIRDMNYDSLKLSTIPQKIGVKHTKIIGVLLLAIFLMLEFFKDNLNSGSVVSTFVISFLTALFLLFSKQKQHRYYSSFWVEALPIWWLVLLFLSR